MLPLEISGQFQTVEMTVSLSSTREEYYGMPIRLRVGIDPTDDETSRHVSAALFLGSCSGDGPYRRTVDGRQ